MKLDIQLFISGRTPEIQKLIDELDTLLTAEFQGEYKLAVVDVLTTPEKAVEHDIFSTPTLMRELPAPVVKLIGRLSSAQKIIGIVRGWDTQHPDEIIII